MRSCRLAVQVKVLWHFVCPHLKIEQLRVTVERRKRHVDRIAPGSNEHAPGARAVVPRIKRAPRLIHIDFKPRMKVHGGWSDWYANIRQIAAHVACRVVEGPAERHPEMGEIAAHPTPLLVGIPGRRAGQA